MKVDKAFTTRLIDSRHKKCGEIECAALRYEYAVGTDYFNGKKVRVRKVLEEEVKRFIEENNIFSDFNVRQWHRVKRDGILIMFPAQIQIITDVQDDRPLPSPVEHEIPNHLDFILRMMNQMFNGY